MPVDGRSLGQVVVERHIDEVAHRGVEGWPWHRPVVGPGVDPKTGVELDGGWLGGEVEVSSHAAWGRLARPACRANR